MFVIFVGVVEKYYSSYDKHQSDISYQRMINLLLLPNEVNEYNSQLRIIQCVKTIWCNVILNSSSPIKIRIRRNLKT